MEKSNQFAVKDILMLLLIVGVGLWVRLDNLLIWQSFPEAAFIDGQPLLTNFDGYYYLRLARDLVEHTYTATDTLRAVPDYWSRPFPPPLLSYLIAKLTLVTPFSLDWIGVTLPAILGALLAFPLFGLGWIYGGRVCAYTAALFGVLSHYHVFRTQLGWLDTDCLNVFFPLAITLTFMGFALCGDKKRYFFFCLGILGYALFFLWWDQATQVVTVLSVIPAVFALVFYYRPSLREGIIFVAILTAGIVLCFSFFGWGTLGQVLSRIFSLYRYISKGEAGVFPNIGVTVAEQGPVGFVEAVELPADSVVVFTLAVIGIFVLVWQQPRKCVFLIPYVFLALFSLFFARRFLLFLTPVFAIGFGVFVFQVWSMRTMRTTVRTATLVLLMIMTFGWVHREYSDGFLPQMRPGLIAGMRELESSTPKDAVVWAWWSYGYALNYHARRATINDGQVHSGERTIYNAVPLSMSSYRLAANFIQFYATSGMQGIHQWYRSTGMTRSQSYDLALEVLAKGPGQCEAVLGNRDDVKVSVNVDRWCSFFFPTAQKTVYLFINEHLRSSRAWYWMGTWDMKKKKGIYVAGEENKRGGGNSQNWQDLADQLIRDDIPLLEAERRFNDSVFSKLYIQHEKPERYFTPIEVKYPYQIWQGKGDTL